MKYISSFNAHTHEQNLAEHEFINQTPKPPSTEIKKYRIKAKDASSWQSIHKELIAFGTNAESIPQRTCTCANFRGQSETTGTYEISEVEAIELRKNPNIQWVTLDPMYHEEARIAVEITDANPTPDIQRFGKNVKNYRTLSSIQTVIPVQVASSLDAVSGSPNWIKVSAAHPNTAAMNYWAVISSLLVDYAIYPSAPASASTQDPLRESLQSATNTVTLATGGWYKIEVVADGIEAYLEVKDNTQNWYDQKPGYLIPLDPRGGGHRYDCFNIGYKAGGTTLDITYKVKNGTATDPNKRNWDNNPGGIGWRIMRIDMAAPNVANPSLHSWPYATSSSGIPASETNRTGYQLKRCEAETTNPFGSNSLDTVSADITYKDDGMDVDCIIVDNGVWNGHPEFCTNDNDPPNFIPGNVLNRSAKSGVLDLILDAPAYLDPEYWEQNPSYLTTRWDGTPVPTEESAHDWWNDPSKRSSQYKSRYAPAATFSILINPLYTRAYNCGTDETPCQNKGDHGTKCASLVYGKNFGWAFNCNKWSLKMMFGWDTGSPASNNWEHQKIFHESKPDNPKFSGNIAKNKTLSSNSWGAVQASSSGRYWGCGYDFKINFRGTETTYTRNNTDVYGNSWTGTDYTNPSTYLPNPADTNPNTTADMYQYANRALAVSNPYVTHIPACLRCADNVSQYSVGSSNFGYGWLVQKPYTPEQGENNAVSQADWDSAVDSMNSGIYYVFAAGNDSNYIAAKNDPDYNNWATLANGENIPGIGVNGGTESKHYFHRAPYPSGISYEATGLNKAFIIGAVDDQYKDSVVFSEDTSLNDYSDDAQGNSTEKTASNGPYGRMYTTDYGSPSYNPGFTTTIERHEDWGGGNFTLYNDRFTGWGAHKWKQNRKDYSNRGSAIDFWAPADQTLAATVNTGYGAGQDTIVDGSTWGRAGAFTVPRNDTKPGSGYYADGHMSGTSAACPVAAGLIACAMQQNRTTEAAHMGGYLSNSIPVDNNYYIGEVPNSADSHSWTELHGNMGIPIKQIKEVKESKKHNNTPNPSLYENSGIDTNRKLNERFTITSASGVTMMIRGIKEFSASDVSVPVTLRVVGGGTFNGANIGARYYPVYTTHSLTSSQRADIRFRIKSGSNDQILEVSNNGGSTWTYFTIRVVNGYFIIGYQGEVYYALNVGDDVEIEGEDETPTYIISTNSQSYNEGQQIITSVQASGIPSGTILYWSLSGTGITSDDFSAGSLTGQVSITDGWQTTFGPAYTVSPLYRVRLDVASGVYTFTANFVDVGTNTTGNPIEVGSGVGAKRYTMGDEAVDAGTAKIYKIKVEEYFGLSGTFNHTLANDLTTEGTETVAIKLFSDSSRNTQIATTSATINDTSKGSTYAIVPSNTSVDEGSTMGYGVGTSNVADGTTLYWSLSGTNITADDFSPSGLTGSGTISNNSFAVTRTVANDLKTEGVETVVFKLFTDSARTNEVASNSTVKIQDTSTTPAGPGYTITPNKTTLDEGDQIIFTVATTNVAENTTLHWQVLADTGNVDANDFGSGEFAGSDQISSGGFTITQNVANDATTEGAEKYTIVLYPDNTYDWPSRLAQSALVTINDTSVSASTYVISPSPAQLDEGGTFTTTVNTTYVDEGTVLYWRLEGSGIDANDFSSGSLTGSGTVNALGTFNFSHTVANDTTTESEEQINICLYGDSARTIKLAETGVIVNDTSQSPTPTYVIQPDKLEYVEGDAVSVKFITSGVAAGTTLHWKMVPTGTNPIDDGGGGGTNGTDNSADFDIGPGMWGSANVQTPAPGVTNDGFGYSWVCNQDQLTEGDETFKIEMYTAHSGGTGGTWSGLLATSPVCTIKDTSTAPGASTYTLTANTNPINEGDYLGLTVTTTNVANGTVLYWEYSGVTSGDLEDGALQGSVTIPPEATKSWGTTIKADTLTEGSETLAVKLYSDSARTTQVGSTLNITINDTSIGSEPTYVISTTDTRFNEGDSFTTTVTTTNVADGTVLYWRLSGTGISEDDFNLVNTVTGSGTITSNTFTFSHTIKEDVTTEGDEVISIKLYSNSSRTTQVGNTLAVTIRDTSQPGYSIRVTAPNNNEYIITGTDRNGSI